MRTISEERQLREKVIDAAIAAGKFPASRRAHYEALWARNPTDAAVVIARLAPVAAVERYEAPIQPVRTEGSVAVVPGRGGGFVRSSVRPLDESSSTDYIESTLSDDERARIADARAGRPSRRMISGGL